MNTIVITKVQLLRSLNDHSDEKITPKFIGWIQAMIDNNPSKSIRPIARNMKESELLIRQVVHEDIRYFSYKIRKSQFLSQATYHKKKDNTVMLLNKLNHPLQLNMLCVFMLLVNIARITWWCESLIRHVQRAFSSTVFSSFLVWEVKRRHWDREEEVTVTWGCRSRWTENTYFLPLHWFSCEQSFTI